MMVALPDITHHTLTVTGAMGHENDHRQGRDPVGLERSITPVDMMERRQ